MNAILWKSRLQIHTYFHLQREMCIFKRVSGGLFFPSFRAQFKLVWVEKKETHKGGSLAPFPTCEMIKFLRNLRFLWEQKKACQLLRVNNKILTELKVKLTKKSFFFCLEWRRAPRDSRWTTSKSLKCQLSEVVILWVLSFSKGSIHHYSREVRKWYL